MSKRKKICTYTKICPQNLKTIYDETSMNSNLYRHIYNQTSKFFFNIMNESFKFTSNMTKRSTPLNYNDTYIKINT